MGENYKFEPLTPKLTDKDDYKYQVYRDALNQAYSRDEIKNIAITGIYGSGKSSVWKTYKHEKVKEGSDNWSDKSVITVALSDFKEEIDLKPETPAYKKKINSVEEQIINQILYQVDSDKIPLSRYEIKNTSSKNIDHCSLAKIILFILGVFLLIRIKEVSALFSEDKQTRIDLVATLIALFLIVIPVLTEGKKFINKYKLHFTKISFQGTTLDLKDVQKDVLNDEMRELVYIITSSDVQTLVFEDLDRFDNIDLFTKLRELNYLVNSTASRVIRFVYLLRDDLFLQQERTKFFDLIIPIVPVINSQNSSGKMLELFGIEEDDPLKPETWVIEGISLYIDDMRLLYSIRNEYEVYSRAIDVGSRKLNPNKLLGMIVLKNVFPKEFDQLQQDKGYVYQLVQHLEINRQKHIENLIIKLEDLRTRLKKLKLLTANTKFELMALHIPFGVRVKNSQDSTPWTVFLKEWSGKPEERYSVDYLGRGANYDYNEFYNIAFSGDKFQRKLKLFKDTEKTESIKLYTSEISRLEDELNEIHAISMHEILAQMRSEDLEDFFLIEKKYENGQGLRVGLNDIDFDLPSNHYFSLIRFLLYEGLLDETYPDYLGYFYESTIGLNDEIFIRKLRDGSASDELFELDNPNAVKGKLIKRDFKKNGIYNHSLLNAILEENDTSHFSAIISVTLNNKMKVDSLLSFLDSLDDEKIYIAVKSLLIEDFDLYWKLLNNSTSVHSLHDKLLVKAFQIKELFNVDREQIKKIREYTNTKYCLLENTKLVDNESFYNGLEKAKVKFNETVDFKVEAVVAKEIERRALYWITIPNVTAIYHQITGTSYNETIQKLLHILDRDEVLKTTESRMNEDVDAYIQDYIEEMNQLEINSDSTQETFIKLLNSGITFETKIKLIAIERAIISDISEIDDEKLWSPLLENHRIEYTQKNINLYFDYSGADNVLLEFLNHCSANHNFSINNTDLANEIVQNEKVNDDVFDIVFKRSDINIESVNTELLNNDKKYRVSLFVEENKLTLTKENYLAIQSLEDEDLLIEYLNRFKGELDLFIGTTVHMNEVTDEAFIAMLDNNILENNRSKTLINNYQKRVSLFALPNANYEIRKHIFDNYLKDEDVQKIIDSSKDFDLWDDFISRMNTVPRFLKSVLGNDLNIDFIGNLMEDSNLSESIKLLYLTKLVENKQYAKYWKGWMLKSSSEKLLALAKVFDKVKYPDYPIDPLIKDLVDLLIEAELITRSKNNKLYFNNQKFKLIE